MKTILAIDLGKSKSVFCKMDTIELGKFKVSGTFWHHNLSFHKPLARFAPPGTFFASFPNTTTNSAIFTSQSSKQPAPDLSTKNHPHQIERTPPACLKICNPCTRFKL